MKPLVFLSTALAIGALAVSLLQSRGPRTIDLPPSSGGQAEIDELRLRSSTQAAELQRLESEMKAFKTSQISAQQEMLAQLSALKDAVGEAARVQKNTARSPENSTGAAGGESQSSSEVSPAENPDPCAGALTDFATALRRVESEVVAYRKAHSRSPQRDINSCSATPPIGQAFRVNATYMGLAGGVAQFDLQNQYLQSARSLDVFDPSSSTWDTQRRAAPVDPAVAAQSREQLRKTIEGAKHRLSLRVRYAPDLKLAEPCTIQAVIAKVSWDNSEPVPALTIESDPCATAVAPVK